MFIVMVYYYTILLFFIVVGYNTKQTDEATSGERDGTREKKAINNYLSNTSTETISDDSPEKGFNLAIDSKKWETSARGCTTRSCGEAPSFSKRICKGDSLYNNNN